MARPAGVNAVAPSDSRVPAKKGRQRDSSNTHRERVSKAARRGGNDSRRNDTKRSRQAKAGGRSKGASRNNDAESEDGANKSSESKNDDKLSSENDCLTVPDEEKKERIAFCCRTCNCSDERKKKIENFEENSFVIANNGCLFHWRCCHKVTEAVVDEDWCSLIEQAHEENLDNEIEGKLVPAGIIPTEIDAAGENIWYSRQNGNEPERGVDSVAPESSLEYLNRSPRVDRPAVVWGLSGGIGEGIVALKRCGVAINRIVYFKQDRIATHVHRWNHDPDYLSKRSSTEGNGINKKPSISDGILHSYVEQPNDAMEMDVAGIIEQYGHVDIVLATPIVVDVADPQSAKERVSLVEKTIQQLKEIQTSGPLFVLVEVAAIKDDVFVPLTDKSKKTLRKKLQTEYLDFDAAFMSPISRASTVFTNIAVMRSQLGPNNGVSVDHGAWADRCLHAEPQTAQDSLPDDDDVFEHGGANSNTFRFPGFLPTWDKIDHPNTLVFQQNDRGRPELQRPLRVQEREALMGYADDYVYGPVHDIFGSLMKYGFGNVWRELQYWKEALPEEYHAYGSQDVDFDTMTDPLTLKLPKVGHEGFFDEHQYACHLIASSSPIPVLEKVLHELRVKFPTRKYAGYGYEYRWNVADDNATA